jgi:hypothetical protein
MNTPTVEDKAMFFAQHLGQEIRIPDGTTQTLTGVFNGRYLEDRNNSWWFSMNESKDLSLLIEYGALLLKPIASISDEDKQAITIYWNYGKFHPFGYDTPHGFAYYSIDTIDFIRSKGYAIRFQGISVEQQVELGWIKLKE